MDATYSYESLQHAIKRGDASYIAHYLDCGGDPNLCGQPGWSLLILAASKGHRPIIDLLLRAGADINASQSLWTPVAFAALAGHTRVVEHLLDHSADVPLEAGGASLVGLLSHYGADRQRVVDLLHRRADAPRAPLA